MKRLRPNTIALGLAACLLTSASFGGPDARRAERETYWWLDEIRSAAWQLAEAEHGKVAQWPRMTAAAGSGTLTLPPARTPIEVDGRLDDEAWKRATTFPVGPLFAGWRRGPITVQISVCRSDDAVFIAIESPFDLSGLGTPTASGELFRCARPFRIAVDGKTDGGATDRRDGRFTAEWKIAAPDVARGLALSFPAELAYRQVDGSLPAAFDTLGIVRHGKPVWLDAISVRLVASPVATRVAWTVDRDGGMLLHGELMRDGAKIGTSAISAPAAGRSVRPFHWALAGEGIAARLDGFCYDEPVVGMLDAARSFLRRGVIESGLLAQISTLESRARQSSPRDRGRWRALYRDARVLSCRAHLSLVDAPLLFVKRHPYMAGHIYDDYYAWRPGGGIYVLENANEAVAPPRVRAVIDADSGETLGGGVYRDAELSWDAERVLFACKRSSGSGTSIFEIGIDGSGLRQLTKGDKWHDITPCYLADDRIAFTSTRPRALVPCFNSGVDTLHTMNGDGSGIRPISSNNVNEFDPTVLADGRILFGRWEYVDKTALYMQSLWTVLPDGTMETALFGNNLAKPTALLDARAVPDSRLVVASLTPHNGQAVGAIATIDPARGKNDLAAISSFTPEYPIEMDQGLRTGPCDPWPLSADDLLISNNAIGAHGVIELIDRAGHRELVHCDPEYSCYAPMLVKPRAAPRVVSPVDASDARGRFLVLDVHEGLEGVRRGTIRRLRVVEETARTSGLPRGGRWWNQAFLVSWQGAYSIKNILGTVPVHSDGSAYFEVPAGKALYLEALDENGREVQRMRTFVQAIPGVTRACVGCHENKSAAPTTASRQPLALRYPPSRPEPESWGSGLVDYATLIQPILDRHCVRCHGGDEDIAAGVDLSGGWTWAFNISYETLLKRNLVGFLRCHNSDVTSSVVLPPRSIGSGAAPLAELLLDGHDGHVDLEDRERDAILAWMDGNSNYYGSWDFSATATCDAILAAGSELAGAMRSAGCVPCHQSGHIGNDWINLRTPERSRILRAPLATSDGGPGLAWCRDRKAPAGLRLVTQRQLPPDVFHPLALPQRNASGAPHVSWQSTDDEHYRAMLAIVRRARATALASPRVDMPGAKIVGGMCRQQHSPALPIAPPALRAARLDGGGVELSWTLLAESVGLEFELHRGAAAGFEPSEATLLTRTTGSRFADVVAPFGRHRYTLFASTGERRGAAAHEIVDVPRTPPPAAPARLVATPGPGEIALTWEPGSRSSLRYEVYRRLPGSSDLVKASDEPLASPSFIDSPCDPGAEYTYVVRALDRRDQQSAPSQTASAVALAEIRAPVFAADFTTHFGGAGLDGRAVNSRKHGAARLADGALDLRAGGHVTFAHRSEFDLRRAFSVELEVCFDEPGEMPVVVSCGRWNGEGWFLQYYGGRWRWHVGGVDCDGGRPPIGKWTRIIATFDGRRARVIQDGVEVASVRCPADRTPWSGPLVIGQYTAGGGAAYQVHGRIRGLRLFHRAIGAEEARERAR